jgi:hypothetical protein
MVRQAFPLCLLLLVACTKTDEKIITVTEALPRDTQTIEALKNPLVLDVNTTLASGQYNAGDLLEFYVQFDKVVEVTGTPKLKLELNGATAYATYSSGSGTNRLNFQFTPTINHLTNALTYTDKDALELAACEIKDVRGANADITLPEIGDEGSLTFNKTLKITRSDNFDNQKISTQWMKLDQDNFDSNGNGNVSDDLDLALIEQNGVLTVSTRGSDLYGTTRQMNGLYLNDHNGNFDYSIKVSSMTNTNTLARAGFFLTTDITNANGGVYFCGTTGASNIVVSYSTTNNNNLNTNLGAGTSVKPVWLRVTKSNKNLTCYYKFNENDAWTPHSSGTRTVSDSTSFFDLGIVATSKNTGSTLQVQFDDFKDLANP